jgi:tRNA threonylcarbamoyladenosine biosynthesis protein TsaE
MPSSTETFAPAETEAVAAQLARRLRPGDIVLVSGDLGAGKTTFVRGACRALGVTGAVTSPSFTIARRYDGQVPISHLDLYRLGDLADEDPALLAGELGEDRITFIEWPEVGAPAGLDPARIAARVHLEHRGADKRQLRIEDARAAKSAGS